MRCCLPGRRQCGCWVRSSTSPRNAAAPRSLGPCASFPSLSAFRRAGARPGRLSLGAYSDRALLLAKCFMTPRARCLTRYLRLRKLGRNGLPHSKSTFSTTPSSDPSPRLPLNYTIVAQNASSPFLPQALMRGAPAGEHKSTAQPYCWDFLAAPFSTQSVCPHTSSTVFSARLSPLSREQ